MNACRGAYAELPHLIQQRHSGEQLSLVRKSRALSLLSGSTRSNFRGRGIDFEEVRSYQPGDDIRTIDWRVTARTGSAHTKMFREERERPVLIAVDLRSNMFFGSKRCLKSVLACHTAALLGWAALAQGDRVGGMMFSETDHREVRPKRSRRTVLSLLNMLVEGCAALPLEKPEQALGFADAMIELRRIARPGSSVYIISDFAKSMEASAQDGLFHLTRHCEVTALHVSDPLEASLPTAGSYRVTDGDATADLFTGERQLQQRYSDEYQQGLLDLQQHYMKLGVPLIKLSTASEPLAQLEPYFSQRPPSRSKGP